MVLLFATIVAHVRRNITRQVSRNVVQCNTNLEPYAPHLLFSNTLNFLHYSGNWNQLTVVYRREIRLLELYLIRINGTVTTRAFLLDIDTFEAGGRLAIGQWLASRDNVTELPHSVFMAEIDEVRIWNVRINPSLIRRNLNINPNLLHGGGLVHLWKFNNIGENFILDTVSGLKLLFAKWYYPMWKYSDLNIINQKELLFTNKSLEFGAERFCHKLLLKGVIHSQCSQLKYGIISYYHKVCVSDIARGGSLNWAIYSVLSFVDHCKYLLNIKRDLTQHLCNHFQSHDVFHQWIGQECKQFCLFGYPPKENKSVCVCEHGYWDQDCSQVCPGGFLNTCNSKGKCDVRNGTCSCHGNRDWNVTDGTLPCSSCLEGWIGAECSIAIEPLTTKLTNIKRTSPRPVCIAFGDPRFTSLNGTSFSLDIQGMYELIGIPDHRVYIIQLPCGLSPSCRRITEVFIASKTGQLSISMLQYEKLYITKREVKTTSEQEKKSVTTILHDSTDNALPNGWQSILKGVSIKIIGKDRLELHIAEKLFLNILLYSSRISVVSEVIYAHADVTGICGSKSNWLNQFSPDKVEPTSSPLLLNGSKLARLNDNVTVLSQSYLDIYYRGAFGWRNDSSLLISNLSRSVLTGPGFAFEFNHNRLIYEILPFSTVLLEWTIELWIHPGLGSNENISIVCASTFQRVYRSETKLFTILSTQRVNGEYLSLQYASNIVLVWGNTMVSSQFAVREGIWTHIAVTWRSHDGRVLFVANDACNSTLVSAHYNIMLGKNFTFDGNFVIGQYFKDGKEINSHDFIGFVDELRIWEYARSEYDISKSCRMRKYIGVAGLILLSTFDELVKNSVPFLVYDSKLLNSTHNDTLFTQICNFTLEPYARPPRWWPSTVPFSLSTNYSVLFRSKVFEAKVHKMCYRYFFTGVLYKYCSVYLPVTASFYFQSCISDIAATSNIQIYRHSVTTFALLCSKELNIEVCNLRSIYDGFPVCKEGVTTELPKIVIIAICVGAVLLSSCCCCFFFVFYRRRKKSKKAKIKPRDKYRPMGADYYSEFPTPNVGREMTAMYAKKGDIQDDVEESSDNRTDPGLNRPLFTGDTFRASSLKNINGKGKDNVTFVKDPPSATSSGCSTPQRNENDSDDELIVRRTLVKQDITAASSSTLLGAYEETETEF